MRITDSHQHFWRKDALAGMDIPSHMAVLVNDYLPVQLRPILDEVGISDTILVQTAPGCLENTVDFLELATANDWIAGVVGWVDLSSGTVGETLDRFKSHPKFKGVRHLWEMEPDPSWIMQKSVLYGLAELARRGIPYDLLADSRCWEYVPRVARQVPDLMLVIDHIAKPNIKAGQFDDWAEAMADAAQFPQMYCKLSGMITETNWHTWTQADLKPYVEKVLELFGPDRVMYGSDWPVCLLSGTYHQVYQNLREILSGLSETECKKIFGENARAFYKVA